MAEVKARLGYFEGLDWLAYRRKHGGIGHARTHFLLANLATMFNATHGGKATLSDFLPGLPVQPKTLDEEVNEFCDSMMGGTYGK